MKKTALIAGATGLVGKVLTRELLDSENYSKIILIVRNPSGIKDEVIEERKVDFDNLSDEVFGADHVFCCLGTTIKKAGSKSQFRKVDYEFPLKIAEKSATEGAELFAVVTAMGASSNSSIFYNQVKGDLEESLAKIAIEHIGIFRPSLILGDREEKRIGEKVGQILANIFSFLIPAKYKGIQATEIAKAMSNYAQNPSKGYTIIENDAMLS